MRDTLTYRGMYVILGAIFVFFITQSSLDNRTLMWVIVAYIVGGIIVTELLRKNARKKKDGTSTKKENVH